MRRTPIEAALLALVLLGGCQDDPPNISLLQLERGGSVDFVCLCQATDGSWSGSPMASCDIDTGDDDCSIFALVLQTNRGEIAVVDLDHRRLHDSDDRAPFTTFPHVGKFPSDLVVSRDGTRIYVVHVGEPTLAIVDTSGILGPTLPEPAFVDLPVEAQSVDLTGDLAWAFVTLPSAGALGRVETGVDPMAVQVLPLVGEAPEPSPDASTDALDEPEAEEDAEDDVPDDVPDDAGEDLPEDVPGDAGVPGAPESFTPVEVKVVEADAYRRVFVSGFTADGGGGVLELDLDRLEAGDGALDAFLAIHLEGTPVAAFDVVHVMPTCSDETTTPEGRFLYAANRDAPRLHVVDLDTGGEIDTSQDDPFAGRAIRTDGNVVDVLAVRFDDEDGEGISDYELDPLEMRGVFVFVLTSTGVVEVVDVYDRACWCFMTDGDPDNDPASCTPHVLRNVFDEEDSYPRWLDEPVLMDEDGETITFLPTTCDRPTPCFDDGEYMRPYAPGDSESRFSYGITFFPDVPFEDPPRLPLIRRPRSETWGLIWEGRVPWTTGVGGNLSADGASLDDPGMYFCAMGVLGLGMDASGTYEGDVLVIEDGPDPLDTDVDCSGFPSEGGAAYRIAEATQHALAIEPVAQIDPETGLWSDGFDLPREECFPFAVRYHVRASNRWIVTASETGFLHSTAIDGEGRCTDSLPACTEWDDATDCTLLSSRASMDRTFVNPYIRFKIDRNGVAPPSSSAESILRPGLGFFFAAISGFQPLAHKAATLPHSIAYCEQIDSLFISDRAWDGLLQFNPDSFSVIFEYN